MLKKGIFAFLSILFFELPIFSQNLEPYSSDATSRQKDSTLAMEIVKGMNDSIAYIDTADDGTNLGSAGIEDGYFMYAPDLSFKILSITGFFCGAYCNPDYYNDIFYKLNGVEFRLPMNMGNVMDIYEINQPFMGKEYLIYSVFGERPRGVETIEYKALYHLRVIGTNFTLIPFQFNSETMGSDQNVVLSVQQSVLCTGYTRPSKLKDDYFIDIRQSGKLIVYQTYEVHEYDLKEGEDLYCTISSGKLKYVNGSFVEER